MKQQNDQNTIQSINFFLIKIYQQFSSSQKIEISTQIQNFIITKILKINNNNNNNDNDTKLIKIPKNMNIRLLINSILKHQSCIKYVLSMHLMLYEWMNDQSINISAILTYFYELLNSLLKYLNNIHQNNRKKIRSFQQIHHIDKNDKVFKINKYTIDVVIRFTKILIGHQFQQQQASKSSIFYLLSVKLKHQVLKQRIKSSKLTKIIKSILCINNSLLQLKQLINIFNITKNKFQYSQFKSLIQKLEYSLSLKLLEYSYDDYNKRILFDLIQIVIIKGQIQIDLNELDKENVVTINIDEKEEQNLIKQKQIENKILNKQQQKNQFYRKILKIFIQSIANKTSNITSNSNTPSNLQFGYHILCYLLKNINNNSSLSQQPQFKQFIYFTCIKHIRTNFTNHKQFYNIIIETIIKQKSIPILRLSFNFIQIQTIENFCVQKLKSLFKLLAEISKKLMKLAKKQININNDEIQISKLKISRIIKLIEDLTLKFKQSNIQMIMNSQNSVLKIQKPFQTTAMIFNIKLLMPKTDKLQLMKFKIGKLQTYQIFLKPHRFQKLQSNKFTQLIEFVQQPNLSQLSISIFCNQKQLTTKTLILSSKNHITSQIQLFLSINSIKKADKHVIIEIVINNQVIEIKHGDKKNFITYVEMGKINATLSNLYFLSEELPNWQQLFKYYQNQQANYITSIINKQISAKGISYKINQKSQQVFLQLKKDESLFFKNQVKYTAQNIIKTRSITFIQIFQQIGGLKSIFYILDKINKSYSTHFAQKSQYFFIQIFKILRNLTNIDKNNFIFKQVSSSYNYLSHFIFLIFRKNQHLANQNNTNFIQALFKFFMYFSSSFNKDNILSNTNTVNITKSNNNHNKNNIMQLQLIFIKQILCNFQLWIDCSFQIQNYVFKLLQCFINEYKYIIPLFTIDIHSKLMFNITFFSDNQSSPFKNKLQQKILMLCEKIWDKMILMQTQTQKTHKNSSQIIIQSNKFTQILNNKKQIKSTFQRYAHRDVNSCLSCILSLINSKKNNKFVKYQYKIKTFQNLCNYFISNFIDKKYLFERINDDWNYVLNIIQNIMLKVIEAQNQLIKQRENNQKIEDQKLLFQAYFNKQRQNIDIKIKLIQFGFKIIQKKNKYFYWIINLFEKVMFNFKIYSQIPIDLSILFTIICQIINLNKKYKLNINNKLFSIMNDRIDKAKSQQIFKFLYDSNFKKNLFLLLQPLLTLSEQFNQYLTKLQKFITEAENSIIDKNKENNIMENKNNKHPQLIKIINNFQQNLFLQCYLTTFINKGNKKWIEQYIIKKSHPEIIEKIFSLQSKKIINQTNLKLSFYCLSKNIVDFMFTIYSSDTNYFNKGQNLNKNKKTFELTDPLWFFVANKNIQLTQINYFSEKLNSYKKQFQMQQNQLNTMIFLDLYYFSRSLHYLLNVYSYSQESQQYSQKPSEAIKRKQFTLISLNLTKSLLSNESLIETLWILMSNSSFSVDFNEDTIIKSQKNIGSDNKKTKALQLKKKLSNFYDSFNQIHHNPLNNNSKKTNIQQRQIFYRLIQKLKYINQQLKTDEEKVNEVFSFFYNKTKNTQSKKIIQTYLKIINTSKFVIYLKKIILILQNPQLFIQNSVFFISDVQGQVENKLIQTQGKQYHLSLTQRFYRIVQNQHKKIVNSQKLWKQIQKENQFWLQLECQQQKDQIYELDQKQIGPLGFYKLNIKPARIKVENIDYPKRKIFSSLKSQQSISNETQQTDSFISKSKIYDFSQAEDIRERRKTTLFDQNIIPKPQKINTSNQENYLIKNSFLCEYVTKRGVYAGKLLLRQHHLQFKYLSHLKLPQQRVYQMSTGKFHQINQLTQQQSRQLQRLKIPFKKCQLQTRRYILRHTAIQLFEKIDHKSYFFNLFKSEQRKKILDLTRNKFKQCIENKKQDFKLKKVTEEWITGILTNFQYLSLVNKYSGRSLNDLAQYYVFPWVISNFNGKNGYNELDEKFIKNRNNLRDLTYPPGKLGQQKFMKLKMRLAELDFCQPQQRFLYGTMFSNPTVLYNFFIRLQPYIQLHWQHQGKRIDHADRLFSGIQQQFNSVITASSDMKQLTPQFYYWPQFLKNRSFIDLGQKQNKQQVDDVVLPVWAKTPQEFIFKMRYVLQSNEVSQFLHQWINLTFGYKVKYENAQANDNLYHYDCYQKQYDYFQTEQDDKRIKSLQVSISQFGQVPQALFDQPHPIKNLRSQLLQIDRFLPVKFNLKSKNFEQLGFQTCRDGIFIWTNKQVEFKKSYISQNYSWDQQTKIFPSHGSYTRLMQFQTMYWVSLNQGMLRIFHKKLLKFQKTLQTQTFDILGTYLIYSKFSQLYIDIYDLNRSTLENLATLHGHKDEVFEIKCSKKLDILLSVDLQGFVMIHELSNLSFLRNFQISLENQWIKSQIRDQNQKRKILKTQIHEMGYFIFLLNQKKLVIYTFLGELFLQQDIEISRKLKQEQLITDMVIFSHDRSLILLSTNKGNIYQIDFIQIKRFNQIFPFKSFSRIQTNILQQTQQWFKSEPTLSSFSSFSSISPNGKKQSNNLLNKAIKNFRIQKIPGQKICLYQIIVQYEDNQILCFYQEQYLGKQLKQNQKLKQIGLFF